MRTIALALLVIVGTAGAARATKVDTAGKKALRHFFSDLSSDPAAVKKFLTGCQFMFLPSADGARISPTDLTLADLGLPDTAKLTASSIRATWNDTAAGNDVWFLAEVDAKVAKKKVQHFRVTGVIAKDKVWTLLVAHWAVPIKDKVALARAAAGTLPAPVALTDQVIGDEPDDVEWVGELDLEAVSGWVETGAVLIGSAPGETVEAYGDLHAWKVTLAAEPGVVAGSDDGADWVAANVTAHYGDVEVVYRMTMIRFSIASGDSGGEGHSEYVLVQFSNGT